MGESMLIRWQSTIVDQRGNVAPGAVLTIRRESDQAIVTVYRDAAGTDAYPTGSVTADESGYAYFYAAADLYRIRSVAPVIDWRDVNLATPNVTLAQVSVATLDDLEELIPDQGTVGWVWGDEAEVNGLYVYDEVSGWVRAEDSAQPASKAEISLVQQTVSALDDGNRLQANQPNFLSLAQSQFDLLPRVLNGAAVKEVSNGTVCLKIDSDVNGTARVVWSVPAVKFTTGMISAQLTILSADTGTGGTIRVYQRDGSNQQIAQATLAGGVVGPVTVPTTYAAGGIAVHEDAVNVELDIALSNSSGSRQAFLYAPLLADGANAAYRQANPETPPTVNYFPNPELTSSGANTYQGSPADFDGYPGVEMNAPGSSRQVIYDMPVRAGFRAGDTVTLRLEAYSDGSGNNTSADISLIPLDASGGTIGAIAVTGVTAATTWQTLQQILVVPVGTATLRVRLTKRSNVTLGRFRKALLLSESPDARVIRAGGKSEEGAIPPALSFFPNPRLTSDGATTYQATPTTFDGEYGAEMTGSSTQQVIYEMPARLGFAAGDTVTLRAQIYSDVAGNSSSTDMSIIAVNSSGGVIGSTPVTGLAQAATWESLEQTVQLPAGTALVRLRFVKRSTAALGRIRRVALVTNSADANVIQTASSGGTPTGGGFAQIFVNAEGNDANDGTESAPVATLSKAVQLANPGDTVVINKDTDFFAGASVSGKKKLTIAAARNVRCRIILGTQITGITKTTGHTKVYQASLAAEPALWLWQHDVDDVTTEITAAERVAYQRGRAYRLTSTKISKVSSIAEIDSSSTPSWFWESGTLYFSVSGGGDATGAHVRVPVAGATNSGIFGGTGMEDIELFGVHVLYAARDGIDAGDFARFRAVDCSANFGGFNGISYDDCLSTELEYCETAGNRGDGDNGHRLSPNVHHTNCNLQNKHAWSHDNYDDGSSMHEDFRGAYIGGLFEYNGDRGIATSYGAHAVAYGTIARKNGQIDTSGGEGFCCIGTIDPDDDPGVGTQMDCFNTISEGNLYNYRATAGHSIHLHQATSLNPVNVHFQAETGGRISMTDVGYAGAGTLKGGSGTFVVGNTTKVTA